MATGIALGLSSSTLLAQSGGFFQEMDKNGDGKITADEAGERWERLGKADKDGDGGVTRMELVAAMAAAGGGPMFEHADKNADGKITQDEAGERWERLGKADTDGDGAVSKEEFAAAMRQFQNAAAGAGAGGPVIRPEPREFFSKMDKNGDGALTADEVPGELWGKLSKADANTDGKVTPEELKTARAAAGGPGEGPASGGAGQIPKRPPVGS